MHIFEGLLPNISIFNSINHTFLDQSVAAKKLVRSSMKYLLDRNILLLLRMLVDQQLLQAGRDLQGF
jgi:hypothetical protein